MNSECEGLCCTIFPVASLTIKEIEDIASREVGETEAKYIFQMLIPLQTDPPRFTCKYHDKTTFRCTTYENRPRMCSEYPYEGESCHWCGMAFKQPAD